MLRTERLGRKSTIRTTRRPHNDMALASTVVFFGVFPLLMAAGFLVTSAVLAFH